MNPEFKIMKNILLLFLAVLSVPALAQFDQWFNDNTLRIDYYHSGDSKTESYSIDELLMEPYWGGSKINLVDTFNYGHYFFQVRDKQSRKVIYSRGYSTLFGEWQTTDEANRTRKSFSETVVMPFPKKDVIVEFFSRNYKGDFEKRFSYDVDVNSYFINPQLRKEYKVYDVHISRDPAKAVDIVILPEGYTKKELKRFKKDCKKFAEQLFSFAPYDQNKNKFNIRAVLATSKDSGADIPADSVWKHTIMNSGFYTFDSERYCMTTDNKSVRDLAANAPYDQIYILLNDPKYGGGGIFNHYCMSVNSHSLSDKIIIHEFGHGFAGLGDEYYNSSVAYSEFYPLHIEPWEPNLTTLVDFDKKWKDLLDKDTPIPTPATSEYNGSAGVFEGGGYVAKGVYRPADDCLMNSFRDNKFCDACTRAIRKMIDFYTE